MKRLQSEYILAHPARRPLRIFASDPMLANTPGNRITIDVPNEPLDPGPIGSRFEVIDYDGAHKWFYPPVNLDDQIVLIQNGMEPTESDPRFHQQMVYAVAMRTLENFERALGRRLEFRNRPYSKLRLLPHAFQGANAAYYPELNAILFGYFRADRKNPGPNLPGQTVFTCLSHDIIVHEFTHAVVDRLRPYFIEPSNPDVLAFHEGFSDIVALFQHFTFKEFLFDQIQKTQGDIRSSELLVEMARQFGYASGANQALRSAICKDQRLRESVTEPHERGSILVAAVFEAFFNTYQRRIRDLIRIATGGTGRLPEGDLHPDLVNRIASEATHTAQAVLTMCIRAFDYLPPVDVTFGDYLRALVTADYELQPTDESGLRGAMIEAFRVRGIYPENVASLAEESLIWPDAPVGLDPLDPVKTKFADRLYLTLATFNLDPFGEVELTDPISGIKRSDWGSFSFDKQESHDLFVSLHQYATANAQHLQLDLSLPIQVSGFHVAFRRSPDGILLPDLVVEFLQRDISKTDELGGIPLRGGTTMIARIDGRIRHIIAKPLADMQRLERQRKYLGLLDLADPQMAYGTDQSFAGRMLRRMKIASLHQGVSA